MTLLDVWNVLKNKLSKREKRLFPKERQVWLVHLGQNVGHEQNGVGNNFARPVLVLKKLTQDVLVVLPLTSKDKKGTFYFKLDERSTIVLSQIKVLDRKRFIYKKGIIGIDTFENVQKKSSELLFAKKFAVDPEGNV